MQRAYPSLECLDMQPKRKRSRSQWEEESNSIELSEIPEYLQSPAIDSSNSFPPPALTSHQDRDDVGTYPQRSPTPFVKEASADYIVRNKLTAIPRSREEDLFWITPKLYIKKNIASIMKGISWYQEDWTRVIHMEAQVPVKPSRKGVVKIDTSIEDDLISLGFAKSLGLANDSTQLLGSETKIVNGERVAVLGKADLRWWCDENNIPKRNRLNFPPKFLQHTFTIVSQTYTKNQFDAILGRKTIAGLPLFTPPPDRTPLSVFTFFRSSYPKVDEKTVAAEQKAADEKREKDRAERKRREAEKDKKDVGKTKNGRSRHRFVLLKQRAVKWITRQQAERSSRKQASTFPRVPSHVAISSNMFPSAPTTTIQYRDNFSSGMDLMTKHSWNTPLRSVILVAS